MGTVCGSHAILLHLTDVNGTHPRLFRLPKQPHVERAPFHHVLRVPARRRRRSIFMNKHVMLALSALALAACGQQAQQAQTEAAPTETVAQVPAGMTDAEFIQAAAQADQYEIQLSQLAADRALRQDVKDLAATLVREHTAASQQLMQLASAAGVTVAPTLTVQQNDRINNLRNNSGETFDDAFLDTQVEVHETAIATFERYLQTAGPGELRTFAEATLPKLRDHHQRTQSLENAT
jgi:putative membrane protein